MENAKLLAQIMGPVFLVLGLSVLLYVKVWQKVVEKWRKDHFSLIPIMSISLILGLISVHMYNVWEWNVWLLVTLTGWGLILKSVLFMLFPGDWLKSLLKMWEDNKVLMYLDGLFATVVGLVLCYYTYFM